MCFSVFNEVSKLMHVSYLFLPDMVADGVVNQYNDWYIKIIGLSAMASTKESSDSAWERQFWGINISKWDLHKM